MPVPPSGKVAAIWRRIRGPLEFLLWAGLLIFLFLRLGPQLGAVLGMGGGEAPLAMVSVRTLDDQVLTADDLAGKVVLVNAWATWCAPCVIEMPGFQRVYDDYRDQGFMVLGVSRDTEGPAKVRAFLQNKGITYPVAMAAHADLGGITEVSVLPTSYLIGRDGTIRHRIEGLYPGPSLRLAVKRLLAEEK